MSERKKELQELDALFKEFRHAAKHLFGYTISLLFNYSKLLRFLKFPINNIGDPYSEPSYLRINTLSIEKKVVDRLADLFHAPKKDRWGYVTNGGTEGNLHSLYIARELYPKGIVFLSDQTHYSAIKSLRILRMPYFLIKSQLSGEINYELLEKAIQKHCKHKPPILFVNIGTTMKGAIDDLSQILKILSRLKIKQKYIHCDAAFYGMVLPFIPNLTKSFDFRAGIDSIVISGHKMIGSPIPCGVIITKESHVARIETAIEYVGINDRTVSGSRNGITPLFLWHELVSSRSSHFETRVAGCFEKASYIIEKFNAKGVKAWKNPYSLTIILPRPSEKLARKWQLPVQGKMCCMIALPQLTYKMIDKFIKEFVSDLECSS